MEVDELICYSHFSLANCGKCGAIRCQYTQTYTSRDTQSLIVGMIIKIILWVENVVESEWADFLMKCSFSCNSPGEIED